MQTIDQAITELSDRLQRIASGLGLTPDDFRFRSESHKGEFHIVARVGFLDFEESICVPLEADPCPEFAEVLVNRFRAGIFGSQQFNLKQKAAL